MAGKRSVHDILREYLVAINFQVDEEKGKKVNESLDKLKQRIEQVGTVAVGAAVALSTSVTRIATSLENLYFASQRTGASVANIKALEFSAAQIGITAEASRGMLEAFARSLRLNPGLTGYLRSMGIDTTKDKVEVLMSLVDKLRKMPFPVAARIAGMFGIDDNTLMMMIKHYDELRKTQEEQKKFGQNLKYDEMAEHAHKFMMELRELGIKAEGLGMIIAARLLPAGHALIKFLTDVVDFLIRADKATDGWSSRLLGLGGAVAGVIGSLGMLRGALGLLGLGGGGAAGGAGGAGLLLKGGPLGAGILGGLLAKWGIDIKADEYNTRAGADNASVIAGNMQSQAFIQQYKNETGRDPYAEAAAGSPSAWRDYSAWLKRTGRTQTKGGGIARNDPNFKMQGETFSEGFLARHPAFRNNALPNSVAKDPRALVKKYAEAMGVDVSLEEAQAWWESRFNPNARSKKGAIGIMQLMPDTAKALGVNPNDMEDNIRGGVMMMHNLLQKYGGNVALALAAYNAGGGAVGRYGGVPPFAETQQYVAGVMANMDRYRLGQDFSTRPSVVMTQKTDINVNGVDSPEQVGRIVTKEQDRVNGDMQRNLQGAMR